ncbi:MAG: DivIVA domain-containing protein [Ruminococcaceae bacterium]|jgi:cell division initiation protein|nr:DivIVA domain-containing protein [Oscillospiraceae bacterium]
MLTPQEVAEHAFVKSTFGGYNMTMVDEFLDELTDDYTALYKENAALKAKMKVLVDKVEEYRATEDSMRSALLAAQKMASNMVSEAEEKKETLLADAEMEARAKIGALHDEIVFEQKRLNAIKASTREFVEQTRAVCQTQLEQLDKLPDLSPEEIEQTSKEAKRARDAAADIAALGEKIVASYERGAEAEKPQAPAAEQPLTDATVRFTPIHQAEAPVEAAEQSDAEAEPVGEPTRAIRISELKFGRNYSAENDN